MRKNSLIFNILVLSMTGLAVKILGMINKIVTIRLLGLTGMSLYTLALPTIMMFITLSEFNFPLTLSKLVSENKTNTVYENRSFIISAFRIGIIISSILSLLLLILIYPITKYWLLNDDLRMILLCSIPLIYLVMISGILKGYLNGNDLVNISSTGVLIEQIIRISFSLFVLLYFKNLEMHYLVSLLILSMSIGELASIAFLLLRIRKITTLLSFKKKVADYRKDIIRISFPESATRLIFSLSNFIEPILYSFALRSISYSNEDVTLSITSITGYAIPLLLLFSFLNIAVTNSFIPTLSKLFKKNIIEFRKKLNLLCITNGVIGGLSSILIFLYAKEISILLYGNTYGANSAYLLALPFFFYFLQTGMHIGLIIIGENKKILLLNILSTLIKFALIYFLSSQKSINFNGLVIALSISIVITYFSYFIVLYKSISFKQNGIIRLFIMLIIPITYKYLFLGNTNIILGILTIVILYVLLAIVFFQRTFKTLYHE